MLVRHGEVDVGLAVRGGIERSLHQMLLHRRASTLGVVVEQEQALGQLSVVQSLGFQHLGGHGLVVAGSHQLLHALAAVLLAYGIELAVEGKLLDIVEIFLLEVGGGHVVLGIYKGEHILEHAAGGTRCGHKLHHLLTCGLILLPGFDILLAVACRRGNDTLADGGCGLQFQEREASLELA